MVRHMNSTLNQLGVYVDKDKHVEQVKTGSCFHSICFFLLDEQKVAYEASCTAAIAGKVNNLTQREGKQEAMRRF